MTSVPSDELLVLEPSAQDLLFRAARTANTFADEPVTDDQLRAIYELYKWAPTSANIQPMRVLVVRTAQAKERLMPHLFEGNRAKTATAPAVAVLAVDSAYYENIPKLLPFRPEMRDVFANPAIGEPAGRFNATLQAGYFILAVRAAGLATGPMAGFDSAGLDHEFFEGTPLRSILVVNIGKPGESAWFDRLPRLEFEDVVTLA